MTFYESIKAEARLSFVCARLETLISQSLGCIDANFEKELHNDFQSRVWELQVHQILLDSGFSPQRSLFGGPDFGVKQGNQTLWVEATAPGRGDSKSMDRVPEPDYGSREARKVPLENVVMRFAQAILEKSKHREKSILKGKISADDPYVIALSGAKITEASSTHPSCGLRATLGWSNPAYLYDRAGNCVERGFERIEHLQKASGSNVSTCPFLTAEFSGISAILWSTASILSFGYDLYSDLEVIHNPYAKTPLPTGLFRNAIDYVTAIDSNTSEISTYQVGDK